MAAARASRGARKSQCAIDRAGRLMAELGELAASNAAGARSISVLRLRPRGQQAARGKDLEMGFGDRWLFSDLSFLLSPAPSWGCSAPTAVARRRCSDF